MLNFSDLNIRLKASWRAFTQEDMDQVGEVSVFLGELDKILQKYTLDVGRFGFLIKVEDKALFEKEIEEEKEDFLNVFKLKPDEKSQKEGSKYLLKSDGQLPLIPEEESPRPSLADLLEQSRTALKEYMTQMVKEHPDSRESLFEKEKSLVAALKKGKMDSDEALAIALDTLIETKLKFPQAEDLIEKMDVTMDYYDVSNELLYKNPDFKSTLDKVRDSVDPSDLRKFSDAFAAADQDRD